MDPADLRGAVDLSALVQRANGAGEGAAPPTAEAARAEAVASGAEPIAVLPDAVVEGDEQTLQEFMQLSRFMPVVVEMHAAWSSEAQALSPVLARLVRAQHGRLVLVRIDLDAHPMLGKQPQVLALLAGQPVQLFAGNPPEEQIQQLLDEILQVAQQQGLRGRVQIEGGGDGEDGAEPAPEPELPPLHAEAYAAIERGDYEAGISAFERALAENPADEQAHAGLAQVKLLERLQGRTLDEIRSRAAAEPDDLDAQLDVADLDLSGGHVEDAFDRLLRAFPSADADGRTRIRERLLELFEVVGRDDPRVSAARRRLTSLLF
ncbi:tetratricopeptide repeat protein [Pseudoclavibacter chungangensis]|uniref:Tetratricopeptide repeat protein n=2 Tax=Pseudoclavibacter chungangensis TaxID=587635 RepID=A0A7J5C1W0_9MICO|nr:tetratricopeptide repeat protein [Pseudoclavibacter chungangensis]